MTEKNSNQSALHTHQGIIQPENTNPYWGQKVKKNKVLLSAKEYVSEMRKGNKVILSQAITIIESANPDHFPLAQSIVEQSLPYSGKSIRVGITGVPGVGKSTFIECLGKHITSLDRKLAVLAVDPSSERSKGSILGDKTRMEQLSQDPNAYIRPSPSGSTTGGVARKTRETVILCETAGFDVIFIETVGVGQSETVVKSMTDFFLLLALAGAGDELQGIKRGIMEMADGILITKADGDNIAQTRIAKAQHRSALQLFPAPETGWKIPVETCSALENKNVDHIWRIITDFEQQLKNNGWFQQIRNNQQIAAFYEWIEQHLKARFFSQKQIAEQIQQLIPLIQMQKISPYEAAQSLLEKL